MSSPLAPELRQAMDERDLDAGYALLDKHASRIKVDELISNHPLLYELSRWLSLWPDLRPVVEEAIARTKVTPAMTLGGLIYLRLAAAFTALGDREHPHLAEEAAREVLALNKDSVDDYLRASAHFCLASALRQRAKYGDALQEATRSYTLLQSTAPKLGAVVALMRHWLLLQQPHEETTYREAEKVLKAAESILNSTSDVLNQAYVKFLRGRTSRFKGDYDTAAGLFTEAARLYRMDAERRRGDPHKMILRVLTNHARALRLKAKKAPAEKDALLVRAASLLEEARELDGPMEERARVWIEQGYLFLDQGKVRREFNDVIKNFADYKELEQDHVMGARYYLLRFWHTYWILSRDLENRAPLRRAEQFADHALKHAQQTENRRIKARAQIAKGLIVVAEYREEGYATARRHLQEADYLLNEEDQDYVRSEFRELLRKIEGPNVLLELSFTVDKLKTTPVNKLIEEEIKPRIIRRILPYFKTQREMRDVTGLAAATVAQYWNERPGKS